MYLNIPDSAHVVVDIVAFKNRTATCYTKRANANKQKTYSQRTAVQKAKGVQAICWHHTTTELSQIKKVGIEYINSSPKLLTNAAELRRVQQSYFFLRDLFLVI